MFSKSFFVHVFFFLLTVLVLYAFANSVIFADVLLFYRCHYSSFLSYLPHYINLSVFFFYFSLLSIILSSLFLYTIFLFLLSIFFHLLWYRYFNLCVFQSDVLLLSGPSFPSSLPPPLCTIHAALSLLFIRLSLTPKPPSFPPFLPPSVPPPS